MTVYLFAYRSWAFELGKSLYEVESLLTPPDHLEEAQQWFRRRHDVKVQSVDPKNLQAIRDKFTPFDVLLFYGWSWMVPASFTDELLCICLHPSPLPKYRGGSPIQNQVIAGEKTSAVTLFKMGQGLDDGPIFAQKEISLDGELYQILNRVYQVGWELTTKLLQARQNNTLTFVPQDESQATICKRRKPSDGEILPTDTAEQIYNKVRCLQSPYPLAFFKSADGKKIFLRNIDYER